MSKVIVISGAGSGFGALAARALADAGNIVYAGIRETTGRNANRVAEAQAYADEHNVDLRTVELDVSSQGSVDAGVAAILKEADRLDVIIHNAGHMVHGPTEAFTPEEMANVYDTNVLSTQRLNRAALHCPTCESRATAWCCGSAVRARKEVRPPTSPRTSRRKRRWMPLP